MAPWHALKYQLFNMECSNILTDGFLKPTKQLAKPGSILRPFSAYLIVSCWSLTWDKQSCPLLSFAFSRCPHLHQPTANILSFSSIPSPSTFILYILRRSSKLQFYVTEQIPMAPWYFLSTPSLLKIVNFLLPFGFPALDPKITLGGLSLLLVLNLPKSIL